MMIYIASFPDMSDVGSYSPFIRIYRLTAMALLMGCVTRSGSGLTETALGSTGTALKKHSYSTETALGSSETALKQH